MGVSLYIELIKSKGEVFFGLIKHHSMKTNGEVEVQIQSELIWQPVVLTLTPNFQICLLLSEI
jgi:hypothetical protein